MTRRTTLALAAAATAVAAPLLLAPPAQASASGCTGGSVYDCVDVSGSGNYVVSVTAEFGMGPRGAASGYYYIQMPGGTTYKSKTFKYQNQSYWHSQEWSWAVGINRTVPSGKLCAQFITPKYATSRACIDVHS